MKKNILFTLTAVILSIIIASLTLLWTDSKGLLTIAYSSGPAIAVFIFGGLKSIKFKKEKFRWLALACIIPIFYISLVYVIGWQFFDYQVPELQTTLLASLPFIFIASFLEETAWRGYLFNKLKKFGWLKMNLTIGIMWALWHYPVILTGDYQVSQPLIFGLLPFTINVILLSFIFSWIRHKTGGILGVTLLHTFHNLSYKYWASSGFIAVLSESGLILTFVLILLLQYFKPSKLNLSRN